MKRIILISLSLVAVSLLFSRVTAADKKADKKADKNSSEQIIKQMEEDWAVALVKRDQASVDRIVSSDWTLTTPTGELQTKAQADAELRSGSLTIESFKNDDIKVRIYGRTAIVHGLETEKSKYKGKDISGQYRFTDVFVKEDGRMAAGWQWRLTSPVW